MNDIHVISDTLLVFDEIFNLSLSLKSKHSSIKVSIHLDDQTRLLSITLVSSNDINLWPKSFIFYFY